MPVLVQRSLWFQVEMFLLLLSLCSAVSGSDPVPHSEVSFRRETPAVVLRDIPVASLRIVALTSEGFVDETFHEVVALQGVRLLRHGEQIKLPPFEAGVLELKTDRASALQVFVDEPQIILSCTTVAKEKLNASFSIHTLPGWVSLVPPVLAILLAIWWQEVIGALFIATLAGMLMLTPNPLFGVVQTIDPLIVSTLASSGNMQIILFTMLLGAMIGIMSGSGGSQAIVTRLTVYVQSRQRGQLMTWLLGLAIFFDDYGNTLLVGSTMRSMFDRLRISREKLAYIVDSTAAPVAGLALISTWVAVEVGYIQTAYSEMGLPTGDIYQTFVATLPYRFYPILTLIFVGQIAWTGRDYGAMLTAEKNALEPSSKNPPTSSAEVSPRTTLARHALLPLLALCLCLGFGLWVDFDESSRALLLASFVAVLTAILSVVLSRTASLTETVTMGMEGMQHMLPAVVVLTLAWSIGTVCNGDHLNTAGYLVHLLGDELSPHWLPLMTFLLAAIVSFATGTSYGTMGLLIPLCVGIEFQLLQGMSLSVAEIGNHPLMLGTIGAVLGGAIFGDHCSPISDTTVLSSAATGCDHLSHVRTQLPYALTVAGVSIVVAYVPVALGVSPYLAILAAIFVQAIVLRICGQQVQR